MKTETSSKWKPHKNGFPARNTKKAVLVPDKLDQHDRRTFHENTLNIYEQMRAYARIRWHMQAYGRPGSIF